MSVSSIVDVPKTAKQEDLFGISRYEKGLIQFIRNADTPITIAIQGEWGSGKTSLMNSLQHSLCGDELNIKEHDKEFYGIWVNTWQYSLMNTQEQTLVSIVSSIGTQIVNIISLRHEGTGQKAVKSIIRWFEKGTKAIAKVAADSVLEGGGDLVEAIIAKENANQTIKSLRDDLQKAITECLEKDKAAGNPQKGFLFFIDDLDRIDPPVAVQILELLKNIFDLEKCVFVLAIDYDVVVKGLKPKFGELTDKNEREFRSFFDKIIQMPFSMPVASYSIDKFLLEKLQAIGYLSEAKAKDTELAENLSLLCSLSVGSNPRSLKRLLNTVSLINIIANEDENDSESVDDSSVSNNFEDEEYYRLVLNFALICIQIAYPAIYKALSIDGDYINWKENMARQLKLRALDEYEKEKLKDSAEFDEEWEQVLFRICERDSYLSNRSVQISQLLNQMKKFIPTNRSVGDVIGEVMSLSSVTDVQAFDKPKEAIHKSAVLKRFAREVLPFLSTKIRTPWQYAKIASNRVQSNVYFTFGTGLFNDIGATVAPVKGLIQLSLWQHPACFTTKSGNLLADIESAGLKSEFEKLKEHFKKMSTVHKNFRFRYPPFESTGISNGKHRVHLTIEINFSSVEEIFDKERLEQSAEVVADFMDNIAKLKTFSEKYEAAISHS